MARFRFFSFLKKTMALENSPIPRMHIYGLLIFAIGAIIAAPFLPEQDNFNDSDDEEIIIGDFGKNSQDEVLDDDYSEFDNATAYNEFDEDAEDIFKNTFDLDALGDIPSEYEWLTYTVKKSENLGSIFRTLNISQGTLQKVLKVDVKNSLVQLRIDQQLDFLIDEKGILRCLAIPLKNGQQEVLFVRDNENHRYVSYIDPINNHLQEATSVVMIPRDQYKPKSIVDGNGADRLEMTAQNNPLTHEIFQTGIDDIFALANAHANKEIAKEKAEEQRKHKEELLAAQKKQEAERKAELARLEKERKEKEEKESRLAANNQKHNENEKSLSINKDSTIISGKIVQGTFVIDGAAAGLTKQQLRKISDIYKGKIDFRRDLRKGDQFKVLFDRKHSDSKARILAVSFAVKGKNHNLFLSTADGRYYDEYGANTAVTSRFLMIPVKRYKRLSSPFTPRRYHPVLKRYRAHKGTDYSCSFGTEVFSTANGTVVKIGHQFPGAGHYVVIDHGNRIQTIYMHLSKIIAKQGQSVKQGQTIGLAGASGGISTGPHIHYQLEINGHAVDSTNRGLPIYNPVKRNNVSNKQFAAQVYQYKKKLNIK